MVLHCFLAMVTKIFKICLVALCKNPHRKKIFYYYKLIYPDCTIVSFVHSGKCLHFAFKLDCSSWQSFTKTAYVSFLAISFLPSTSKQSNFVFYVILGAHELDLVKWFENPVYFLLLLFPSIFSSNAWKELLCMHVFYSSSILLK